MGSLFFDEHEIEAGVGMLEQQANQFPECPLQDGFLVTLKIAKQAFLKSITSVYYITPSTILNFLKAQADFISEVEETTQEIKQRKRGALIALENLSVAFVGEPLSPPKTKEGSQTLMIEGPSLMLSRGVERNPAFPLLTRQA